MYSFYEMSFKRPKLEKLNRCRLYLQVTTLLDMTDSSRNEICVLAYKEIKNTSQKSEMV